MKFVVATLFLVFLLVMPAHGKLVPNGNKVACGKKFKRDKSNKDTVKRLFDSLLGDTPSQIVRSGELPDVFAADVKGRVDPVGQYDDLTGTIEYFYGLGGAAAEPNTIVSEVNFPYLSADENSVLSRSDVTYKDLTGVRPDFNITLWGFFRFNNEGTIFSYDISAINLGKTLDPPEGGRTAFIQQLCGGVITACTDDFRVYDTFHNCVEFMTNTIPFGTYDEAHGNSVICRSVHLGLAFFRPEIHCAHVSPSGGGKCIDKPISAYYEESY